MSFVITLYVSEGIIMAGDSRQCCQAVKRESEPGTKETIMFEQSDSSNKVFLTKGRVGICIYNEADIEGIPVQRHLKSLLEGPNLSKLGVDELASALFDHFVGFPKPPNTEFHVAGYKKEKGQHEQHVWHISISNRIRRLANTPGQYGVCFGGEEDIMARLLMNVGELDGKGQFQALRYEPIPWNIFSIQDAIDYAIYAIRTTENTIKYQARPNTVGGPIDILLIKPTESFWVQRKKLHGDVLEPM